MEEENSLEVTMEQHGARARNSRRHFVGVMDSSNDVIRELREELVKKSGVQRNDRSNRLETPVLPKQDKRLRRLKDVCTNRLTKAADNNKGVEPEVEKAFPSPVLKEMYVDDRLRYIYCLISKVACTSWKRTLLMMTGLIQSTTKYKTMAAMPVGFVHNYDYSDRYLRRMVHFNDVEAKYRLYNYFKFMFVRDPMERLVSAYRDKVLTDKSYYVNEQIVRQYRYGGNKNKTYQMIRQSGENATFTEFVQYILDQRAAGNPLDRHWAPQSELCSPCRVRYDFIGHYETLHEDARDVIGLLKTRPIPPFGYGDNSSADANNFRFPSDHIHSHGSPGTPGRPKSGKFVNRMLAELDDKRLRKIVDLYIDDYDLFDYERPSRA